MRLRPRSERVTDGGWIADLSAVDGTAAPPRKLQLRSVAESGLADPLERERVRKVFSQGLDKVVGHVLPVARYPAQHAAGPRWQTGSAMSEGQTRHLGVTARG